MYHTSVCDCDMSWLVEAGVPRLTSGSLWGRISLGWWWWEENWGQKPNHHDNHHLNDNHQYGNFLSQNDNLWVLLSYRKWLVNIKTFIQTEPHTKGSYHIAIISGKFGPNFHGTYWDTHRLHPSSYRKEEQSFERPYQTHTHAYIIYRDPSSISSSMASSLYLFPSKRQGDGPNPDAPLTTSHTHPYT